MDPFPLAALPDDELGCVLRATLAANGGTMEARYRLSWVCRRWRDRLRGAQPAHDVGSVGDATQLFASSLRHTSDLESVPCRYALCMAKIAVCRAFELCVH